jgi:hypothetical protein
MRRWLELFLLISIMWVLVGLSRRVSGGPDGEFWSVDLGGWMVCQLRWAHLVNWVCSASLLAFTRLRCRFCIAQQPTEAAKLRDRDLAQPGA